MGDPGSVILSACKWLSRVSRESGWGNRLSGSLAAEGLTCFVFLEVVLPYTKITQSIFELEKGMWGSMLLYSLELFMLLS